MEIIVTINELHKELNSLLPISEEQSKLLERKIRLEFNYNSNHIEGNTLSYAETELLLLSDEIIANHTFRELEEMKASDVAFETVKTLAHSSDSPLTEQFIKEINKVLLVRPYWKDAITLSKEVTKRRISIGEYKKEPNSVMLENGEIYNYSSPLETPALMGDLIEWLRLVEEQKIMHPVEIAAELHYKFVCIHPFDDGNGRISRLLMNYILIKNGFPPIIIKSADKKAYLRALRNADAGDIEAFKKYIAQQLIWSLELSIKAANNENLEEDEDWKKKLSLLKRNLANKDTIRNIKTIEIVQKIITEVIYKACINVVENLSEFDDLFLYKKIFITNRTAGSSTVLDGSKINQDRISNFFFNEIHLILQFQEFTKDPDNPFTVDVDFRIKFSRHKYEFFFDDNLIFKKLYHQIFTDKDIYDFANFIGKTLTSQIEQKINSV